MNHTKKDSNQHSDTIYHKYFQSNPIVRTRTSSPDSPQDSEPSQPAAARRNQATCIPQPGMLGRVLHCRTIRSM